MFVGKIVYNYTAAIFDASGDRLQEVCKQLSQLSEIVDSVSAQYNQAVFNEGFGQKALTQAISRLGFDSVIVNLFAKLVKKGRLKILPLISSYLPLMMLSNSGITQVEVRSVEAITKPYEEEIKSYLKKHCAKDLQIKNVIDKSLLGGIVISFDSFLLDACALTKLAKARDYLSKNKEL